MLPVSEVVDAWQRLIGLGVKPAGLGARDTLRLEAGMNLYGNDMDEAHHPLESGLAWTVAFTPTERRFIGRDSLERFGREGHAQFVGLLLEDRGVLRGHQAVYSADGSGPAGEITSGTFSPTLSRSIALARVPFAPGEKVMVDIRGKLCAARIVKPPFVRHGKALIDI
jgi:aminomethyltransferase